MLGSLIMTEEGAEARRNWTPALLLRLARTYRRVVRAHPGLSRLGVMQRVYDEFRAASGDSQRSRKAVDDKLYAMKQMYHFILKMNGSLRVGQRPQVPSWFELTKDERRAVRALHRVRIPNISLDVFRVLDSVLNPVPLALEDAEQPDCEQAADAEANGGREQAAHVPDVVDAKRNWGEDVTLELAKTWNRVLRDGPELRGAALSHRVYSVFMRAVGFSNRTRKAVDDKMHSMREMYRFIRAHEARRVAGDDRPSWFDLPKHERRELRARHKIRVPNLTREVYDEVHELMTRSGLEHDHEDDSTFDPPTGGDSAVQPPAEDHTVLLGLAPVSDSVAREDTAVAPPQSSVELEPASLLPASRVVEHTEAPGQSSVEPHVTSQARRGPSPGRELQLDHADLSAAITAETGSEPAAKRRRASRGDGSRDSELLDAPAARLLREEFEALLAAERAERRRQHAEQMGVLREIAALLRQRP